MNWRIPEISRGVFGDWQLEDETGKVLAKMKYDHANLCYRDQNGNRLHRDFNQARKVCEGTLKGEEKGQGRLML